MKYAKVKNNKGRLKSIEIYEGESIETKCARVLQNNEPITTGTSLPESPAYLLSISEREMPSTTGPTVSRCEGLGTILILILLPHSVTKLLSYPRWYFTSPRDIWPIIVTGKQIGRAHV